MDTLERNKVQNVQVIDLKLFKEAETQKTSLSQIQKAWDENSAFYDVTKIIISIMRLTGRYPYIIIKGKMDLKLFSPVMISSLIFFGVQCFIAYVEFCKIIKNMISNNDFDLGIISGMFFLFFTFQMILPLTAWTEWPSLCDYYNHWKDFEIELKNKTGIELKRDVAKIFYGIAIIEIPIAVYLGYAESEVIAIQSLVYTILVFAIININIHMYLYLWIFSCIFIGKASESLLKHILEVVKSDEKNIPEIISTCRLLWLKISELSTMLADTLAPTMLYGFLMCGITFIMASYALLYSIKIGEFNKHTMPYVCFLLITCTVVVAICDSAHRTTYKVGTVFQSEIMKIETSTMKKDARKELYFLLTTTGNNHPSMMFAGFFTINRHLFVSFLSSTVTYLIVMVQFEGTQNDLININNSNTSIVEKFKIN